MGKVLEKKKKKKGRPSLLDLQKRSIREQQEQEQQRTKHKSNNTKHCSPQKVTTNYNSATTASLRRSTRRNPNPLPEGIGTDEEEGEDDELDGNRREKKLKLVLKLQKSSLNSNSNASDSDENPASNHRKRKINAIGSGSAAGDCDKNEKSISGAIAENNDQGVQLESGPSTPLPDKKLLLFILDRLQKKDTYGVFSEPVDPEELPDYHEIIERPMDFATVKKKLTDGAYSSLEEFENDVFLICSNAMQYNAPETIYFRQARSIHELAKKDFENLRQDSDDNDPEPKVVRRGRPPTKNLKKPLGRPPLERARSEIYSDATLATGGENSSWANYDLRKGTLAGAADLSGRLYGSRNEGHTGWLTESRFERNEEVSLAKGYSKHGKKQFVPDDNRRNSYTQFLLSSGGQEPSVLSTFDAERKQLMTVGLLSEHSYTRSLSRFATNLGPIAWKIASRKIERCLPSGVEFGPGWVGENDVPQSKPLLHQSPSLAHPMKSESISVPRILSSAAILSTLIPEEDKSTGKSEGDNSSSRFAETQLERANSARSPSQLHQNPVIRPGMNGLNGAYGFHLPAEIGKLTEAARSSGFNFQSSQALDPLSRTNKSFVHPVISPSKNSEDPRSLNHPKSSPKADSEPTPQTVPPDLNIKFQSPGSPNSSRVDSPHPDLALQL